MLTGLNGVGKTQLLEVIASSLDSLSLTPWQRVPPKIDAKATFIGETFAKHPARDVRLVDGRKITQNCAATVGLKNTMGAVLGRVGHIRLVVNRTHGAKFAFLKTE
jgi:MoxR-like ATPase